MRDRNAPLTAADISLLEWKKMDGLIPAAVQDARTLQLLMLGYMNQDALARTFETGLVTFYSRSKGRLWTKGETSGNHLKLVSVHPDCDSDALLVRADPVGPTCHLNTESCFTDKGPEGIGWLGRLAAIVEDRAAADPKDSYTARLLAEGALRVAQKVGEEGVEVALAGVARSREDCIEESADLIYHLTVLMRARGFGWDDIAVKLSERHR